MISRLRQYINPKRVKTGVIIAVVICLVGIVWIWLRQPLHLTEIELAEQRTQCVLWKDKIKLNLDSLKSKYITDRDLYLLVAHRRINTLLDNNLAQCSPETNIKEVNKTLDQLAIQLSQKDNAALETITALQALF